MRGASSAYHAATAIVHTRGALDRGRPSSTDQTDSGPAVGCERILHFERPLSNIPFAAIKSYFSASWSHYSETEKSLRRNNNATGISARQVRVRVVGSRDKQVHDSNVSRRHNIRVYLETRRCKQLDSISWFRARMVRRVDGKQSEHIWFIDVWGNFLTVQVFKFWVENSINIIFDLIRAFQIEWPRDE